MESDRGVVDRPERPVVRSDPRVFDDLAGWWDTCPGPLEYPFLRSEWFKLWADSFLADRGELEVVIWQRDASPIAALPLWRRGRRRRSLSNAQTMVFDLIGGENSKLASPVHNWLGKRPMTRLFALDGRSVLVPAPPEARWHVDRKMESLYVDLTSGTDATWEGFSRNLRRNLKRKSRKLDELGEVVYLSNAVREIPDALERCLHLEASGWKGRVGSAMLSRPDTARFYRALAEVAQDRGWLRLSTLMVAERLVAFEFDLDYAGHRFSLKSGYDEDLGPGHSPGQVLTWRVIEEATRSGAQTYELGGQAEEWKRQWSSVGRPRLNAIALGSVGLSNSVGVVGQAALVARSLRRRNVGESG